MNQDKGKPEEREDKVGRSVNSSEKTKINHHRTQLTTKTYTKKDQYSIFKEQSTRNNPITLMAPSMLPILNFER